MSTFELARYRADVERRGKLLERWPPAVEAIRERFPGLVHARLAQLDETTWIDVWEWESADAAQRAAAEAPAVPEAAALFEVITEPLAMEHATIVRDA